MKLLVGLGNPGRDYRDTKHNVGYWLIDRIAFSHRLRLCRHECRALVGTGSIFGTPAVVAKPLAFMNCSGPAVRCLVDRYELVPADLILFHDDVDIPVGSYRVKRAGGDAGHRGVRSVIEEVGTGEFTRLRIGVGRPPAGEDAATYVLSPFANSERGEVCQAIEAAIDALSALLASTRPPDGAGASRS